MLCFLIAACNTNSNNVLINGTIKDDKVGPLLYSVLQNNNSVWFKDTLRADENGAFALNIEIEKPCLISLLYQSSNKMLLLEPDKNYSIEIDASGNTISLLGETSEAQAYYESLNHLHPYYCRYYSDYSDYTTLFSEIKTNLNNELEQIQALNCNIKVKELLESERQVYYRVLLSNVASQTYLSAIRSNLVAPTEAMLTWKEATFQSLSDEPNALDAQYSKELFHYYFWYKVYNHFDIDTLKNIRIAKKNEGLIHTYNIELAEQFIPDENLEFYKAIYLQSEAKQRRNKNAYELVDLFESFKAEYPESKYTAYITPTIDKIIANKNLDPEQKSNFKQFEELKITKIDSVITKELLDSISSKYKNKVIYMDFWAPWCNPCMGEMPYSEKIQEHFKNDDIVFLYLANRCSEESWKATIANKNLGGEHILLTDDQFNVLSGLLGISGIPHYTIIDKKGNIVDKKALRPSDNEKLIESINRLL